MIIKIDTTRADEIKVVLEDSKTKIRDQLIAKQAKGSQMLLSLIAQILKKNNKKITDIKEIKVNPGPGSFTGTRVGVSVANALGFALDVPVNGSPRFGKAGKKASVIPKYASSKFD